MNVKDYDRWMSTLSDEARADVMKTAIAATEETARRLGTDSEYQTTRQLRIFLPIAALVLLGVFASAVSCERIDHENETARIRIQAEHPAAFQDAGK